MVVEQKYSKQKHFHTDYLPARVNQEITRVGLIGSVVVAEWLILRTFGKSVESLQRNRADGSHAEVRILVALLVRTAAGVTQAGSEYEPQT